MPEFWFLFLLCGRLVRVLKGRSFYCARFIRFLTRQKELFFIYCFYYIISNLFEYNM